MTRKKIAENYINFIFKHKVALLTFITIFTSILLLLSLKMQYSTRITDLLPPSNKEVSNYLYTINHIGLTDNVIVAIENKKSNIDNIELYSELFIENLKKEKGYKQLFNGIDFNIEQKLNIVFTPFFLEHIWTLIPNNKLPLLLKNFEKTEMESIVEKDKMLVQTGSGADLFIKKDPLNVLAFFNSYSSEMKGKLKIKLIDGYYFSSDKTTQILFLKTKKNADNLEYTTKLIKLIFKTIKKTNKDYLIENDLKKLDIQVKITGPHAITYYDKNVAQNDMFSTLWFSFLLVIIIFLFGFKNPFSLFYAAIPLIVGEIWTFGLSYLIIGRINILTSIVGAILIGLGIDFAIHTYARFLEEEAKNKSVKDALITTISTTGFATIAGGLTTAAAFSSMLLSNFRGLKEFGIVSSLGILSTLFACLLIIPLIISFRKRVFKPKKIAEFGTKFFHKIVDNYPVFVTVTSLAIILFFLFFAVQLRFNTSLRNLRSKTNPALKTQTELTKKLGGSLRSLIVVLRGKSQKDIEKQYKDLLKILKNKKIARIESIFSFIPMSGEQNKNIEFLKKANRPEKVRENFLNLLDKEGFAITNYYKKYISEIENGLNNPSPVLFKDILKSKSYPLFKNYLRYSEKSGYEVIVKVYPQTGLWHKQFTTNLVSTVKKEFNKKGYSNSFITGIDVVINEIKRLVKENFVFTSILSLLLVFLIVYLHFKNFKHSFLSFIPLVSGIIVMLGSLKLSGDNISLYNFIATPMIIGIGIDSGIHILSRVINSKNHSISDAVIHTGKAIIFTSLTTIVGFGSLYLSHFEGFKSLGFSTIIGVSSCMLASLIFFPAILKLIYKGENNDLR